MGSHLSGRYRNRNRGSLEATIRLDIRALRRQGYLQPGATAVGTWVWTSKSTGQVSASVGFTTDLVDPHRGFVRVHFSIGGEPHCQQIQLESRPMRFGGWRHYFRCPTSGVRCEVLPLVAGVFASRQAHQLTYYSQSADGLTRLRDRVQRLRKRAWPDKPRARPRGSNRKRRLDAWYQADAEYEAMFEETALRRFGTKSVAHWL